MLLLLQVLTSFFVAAPITGKVTSFNDTETSKIADFLPNDPGKVIGYIEVPKRSVVTDASFNVSQISNSSYQYPKNTIIDVGDDGKYEWAFSGKGYGNLGQQRQFLDNTITTRVEINGNLFNNNAKIRLPKNATVTSTHMLVDGRANASGAVNKDWTLLTSWYTGTKVEANITGGDIYFARYGRNFFDIYDPITKTFSKSSNNKDNFAEPSHAITLVGSEIYICTYNFTGTVYKLYSYSTLNDTWFDKGNIPAADTSIVYGGLAYDQGSYIYAIERLWGTAAFYRYSILNGTWFKLSSPSPRTWQPTLCHLDNRVYLLNYTSGGVGRDLHFYAPNNNTWFKLRTAPLGGAARLCTDGYNLFSAATDGRNLKYDIPSNTWAITGKARSGFISIIAGLVFSDKNFYLAKNWGVNTGYYNISGLGVGEFSMDPSVDIGDNGGSPEWSFTGEFNITDYVPDFTTELNNLILSTPTSYKDGYGNEFVDIPINVTSTVPCVFTIKRMYINYTYTETVDYNPFTGNLINALNDIIPETGEGNIIIPIKIYSTNPGRLNISNISIEYFIPDLTNNRLELMTGHGPGGRVLYTDYMNYTFLVNITNREGVADVNNVTLYLDVDGENLQLLWDEATDTFSELRDPKDLIIIDKINCSSVDDGKVNWTLEFVVRFNWTYPNETFELCALMTTNDTNSFVYNEFPDVFIVENDLEFYGELIVTGAYSGELSAKAANKHWVHSNETITWSNLTVVYEGSMDAYPADKNFQVIIRDDDTDSWVNSSSSGQGFVILTISDPISDYDDLHSIDIINIPGLGQDVTDLKFQIRTDNDGPGKPQNIVCHADSQFDPETGMDDDTAIFVTWNDATDGTGSGVDYYAVEYNNVLPTEPNASGSDITGAEGIAIFYVRARDKVGNWGPADNNSIFIDLTDIIFGPAQPASETWHKNRTIECTILINDTSGSGVDVDTVQYRYVEEGAIELGSWMSYSGPGSSGESVLCKQNLSFESDGDDKKVQWRAKDLAENGFVTLDPPLVLKIDSKPTTLKYITPQPGHWFNTTSPEIKFFINDTSGSGVDIDAIDYSYSTTGLIGFGNWINVVGVGGGDSLECTVTPELNEGDQNYIMIRAKDLVGNLKTYEPKQILIDVSPPEFYLPIPQTNEWVTDSEVRCNISISDEFSAVDKSTIKYQFSTNGTDKYGDWLVVKDEEIKYSSILEDYQVSILETLADGTNNYIRWRATDLAGNELISNNYQIHVDITPIEYDSAKPISTDWLNIEDVYCEINIKDISGSGVVADSVEYSFSTTGLNGFATWRTDGLEVTELQEAMRSPATAQKTRAGEADVYEQVHAAVMVRFSTGSQNYIIWRSRDLAGNLQNSAPQKINVDLEPVFFSHPEPKENIVYDERDLRCKITIIDVGGSGVDIDSVEYRYSTTGPTGLGNWIGDGITPNDEGANLVFFVDIPFDIGSQNHFQWRASDIARNGPTESRIYNVTVNSPPVAVIDQPLEVGEYHSNDLVFFSANSSSDPDPDDILSYEWSSNVSKFLGNTKILFYKLPAGGHKITLTINDGHGHQATISRDITVKKYFPDFDADNIPDYLDTDDDGDSIPDDEDAFPMDADEWMDTDGDGTGNNRDTDDDGDGVLDIVDDYPLDPAKWEKESTTEDSLLMYLIILIIIIIIIAGVGLAIRSKKKRVEVAKAAEITQGMPTITKSSAALRMERIQDTQLQAVPGVPLLPGTVSTSTTPSYTTPSTTAMPDTGTGVIPQHLVRGISQVDQIQSVQTYIPKPTSGAPGPEPAPEYISPAYPPTAGDQIPTPETALPTSESLTSKPSTRPGQMPVKRANGMTYEPGMEFDPEPIDAEVPETKPTPEPTPESSTEPTGVDGVDPSTPPKTPEPTPETESKPFMPGMTPQQQQEEKNDEEHNEE
jgi:hypothetical protein